MSQLAGAGLPPTADPPITAGQTAPARDPVDSTEPRVSSRTPHRWFVAAAAIVCAAVYPDVLFAGRTFLPIGRIPAVYASAPYSAGYQGPAAPRAEIDPGAHAWQVHPWAYVERRALASGSLPLWDGSNGLGHPLLANGQTQTWNPLHALVLLNPDSGLLWDIHFLLLRFLAALFSCYLLWELGVRRQLCLLGAVFGGVNPAFSIFVNRADLEAYALFPALLFCVFRLRREAAFGNASALLAAIALVTVGGHPEPSFACLLAGGAIAAALGLRRGGRVRFFGWATFAAATALLVTAPYWLPFFKHLQESYSGHPAGAGGASRSPVFALQWLFPAITSSSSRFAILDDPPALGFLGAGMSVLAVSAVLGTALIGRLRVRLFWIAVPALLGMKIFGIWGARWIGKLPLIDRMLTEVYFQFPVLYALGIAGVVVLSELAEESVPRRALILAGAALSLAAVTVLTPRVFPAGMLSRFWSFQALLAAAVIVAVVVLAWLTTRGGRAATAASIALLGLIAGDLAAYRRRLSPRGNLTAAAPYVAWLQARQKEEPAFRVMGFGGRLMPNMAAAFALEDLRVTDALRSVEQMTFIRRFVQKELLWDWFLTADGSRGFDAWNPILDWLNVRYVIAGPEILAGPPDSLQVSLFGAGHTAWDAKVYSIEGEALPVLYQHPNDEGEARIRVPAKHPVMAFALAQDPAVWHVPGDGATYEVAVSVPGRHPTTVFARTIDPKRDPADRRWIRGRVDLSRWAGSEVNLVLRARSGDTRSDWGGWGDLHWESRSGQRQPPPERPRIRYDLAFREPEQPDTLVFENRDVWPRVFASDSPFVERSADAVLDRIQSLLGSPGPHVVVAEDFPLQRWESFSRGDRRQGPLRFAARDVQRGQNDMTFTVEVDRPAAIVVGDTFARGWHATIDDSPAPLFRANYLFRGLIAPAGAHRVRLWYWPREWTVAFVLCGVGFAAWGAAAVLLRRRRET